MRRPFVAGNWKMNMDSASTVALIGELKRVISAGTPIEVAVCPPALYVIPAVAAVKGSPIGVGVQNVYDQPNGAFTGELSTSMLKDVGAAYAIIGHSERRHTIGKGESDALLNAKVKATLAAGLTPIFCIGELLAQRDAGRTDAVCAQQIRAGLAEIDQKDAARIDAAYEPVWAIGTGRVATPEQAQDAHKAARAVLADLFGQDVAQAIRIQYGGSVKPDNAEEIMAKPDVDGALVGGDSLKAEPFLGIIEGTTKAKKLA